MRQYFRFHYLFVFGSTVLGITIGIFILNIQPTVLGWIFGGSFGLTAGSYIVAITSGESLVGGASSQRPSWEIDNIYDKEQLSSRDSEHDGH